MMENRKIYYLCGISVFVIVITLLHYSFIQDKPSFEDNVMEESINRNYNCQILHSINHLAKEVMINEVVNDGNGLHIAKKNERSFEIKYEKDSFYFNVKDNQNNILASSIHEVQGKMAPQKVIIQNILPAGTEGINQESVELRCKLMAIDL